ncbi:MAG: Nif3-like dinuclear metal center hexameric protein [Candidatus Andersenbacteria bacterium RIFCSPHIGHO2_12_FULL_46_9]|nr:MAG: hypothetical protein UW94_C0003G0119 [Parcubacteria group bacterium GW2011_GWA2_45_14]OGY33727.1 MAG: Nif3-like dinuclear metal center hexameric protein [Candidatus Andersenbacteria bacterium RIFCSPHIGHO2_02_FULL_46_16]OGY36161.1 MAG: Nif3-like dinuclear metal center hexameric protein [Candidatus Andersenbacteria bacterium RIFCSPLOWO2_02_FULL_46_11]OGY38044.1 MAG: Nif3-like dinuclear metal center hexameric protein [Candidatus Andersenbacteria bacterium RIFCSPHIGHO2_12_FULL_46_9]OGY42754
MTDLQQIKTYLDEYLALAEFADDSWNGLQYAGSPQVSKIASAVDASAKSFAAAASHGANFLLVHHGHFWRQANPSLVDWQRDRLSLLSNHNLSLYAAHLPLDQHPVVSNNAQILNLLKAKPTRGFYPHANINIGWIGRIKPTPLSSIADQLSRSLATACRVLPFGKKLVTTIAVCSGGGSYAGFFSALAAGVDLYISGDPVYIDPTAQEAKMNVIFAGHYATETLGVQALAAHLSQQYSLEHIFIDLPPIN